MLKTQIKRHPGALRAEQLRPSHLDRMRRLWPWLEALIFGAMLLAFWHHSPPIRDQWVALLMLLPAVWLARGLLLGRVWVLTPLDGLNAVFLALTLFNYQNAPLSRQDYWVLICRPVLGVALVGSFAYWARWWGDMRALWVLTILLGGLLALLGLTATAFSDEKSGAFRFLIDVLPVFDHRANLPDMLLRFNPNEIAGALAWLCPPLVALGIDRDGPLWRRALAGGIGGLLLLALMLGQSRSALGGVFVALALVFWAVIPPGWWRRAALGGLTVLVALEVLVVLGVLPLSQGSHVATASQAEPPSAGLSERDQRTITVRIDIWERAWRMAWDEPLTGVGMSMYRSAIQRPGYQIIDPKTNRPADLPHAHSNWLQLGADLGLAGLLLYPAWLGTAAWLLWRCWRVGDRARRTLAIAIASGFLAHAIYGLGDAITLWDRLAFLFWWFLGLSAACYVTRQLASG